MPGIILSIDQGTTGTTIVLLDNELNIRAHGYREFKQIYPQPGWVEQQYDNSTVVWVTADSVSMIFEALTAGCKVGVIPVDWKKRLNKFEKSVAFLEANGFILPFEAWVSTKDDWSEHENLNEAQRCADIIIMRWWEKNL